MHISTSALLAFSLVLLAACDQTKSSPSLQTEITSANYTDEIKALEAEIAADAK